MIFCPDCLEETEGNCCDLMREPFEKEREEN
jgi:hypothetical protein